MTTTTRTDLYATITDHMIDLMEQGVRPWTQPWQAEHAAGPIDQPLRSTFEPYRGINVLMLWAAALEYGYTSPIWLTFRQAKALGGHVRKGEKGHLVVFAKAIAKEENDAETGETRATAYRFLKRYTVFNMEQIEGLPDTFTDGMPEPILDPTTRIAQAEAFFGKIDADIQHGGTRACYRPSSDTIHMPNYEFFADPASYYTTLAHELIHWTSHEHRLDRPIGHRQRDKEAYAREELVAELGAAFLAAELNLPNHTRDDHAAYLADWLTVLRNDKRAMVKAAAQAQRAVDYLKGLAG